VGWYSGAHSLIFERISTRVAPIRNAVGKSLRGVSWGGVPAPETGAGADVLRKEGIGSNNISRKTDDAGYERRGGAEGLGFSMGRQHLISRYPSPSIQADNLPNCAPSKGGSYCKKSKKV